MIRRRPLTADPVAVEAWRARSRKALPPMSRRRAGAVDAYWAAAERAFGRDGGRCQAVGVVPGHTCWGPLDAHHIAGRDGDLYTDAANLITLCRRAHAWVHDHPRDARALGLLRSKGTNA